jgi:hypothetical protein
VEIDEGLPVTEPQWLEHTEAWRLAHLDRAPSPHLRQATISGQEPAGELAVSDGQAWTSLPHLAVEMLVVLAVVAVVVIGVALR